MSTLGEMQAPPEADRAAGAPHPRETPALFGQHKAETAFLDAFNSGRQHHAWLLTGARGVGKATLAWRIAKFLLATPDGTDNALFAAPAPSSLDIPADHPVAHHIHAMSEARLFLLRRPWDAKTAKLKTVITVDETRKLHPFFGLSAIDGGRRVVIIDAADEMNPSAANAILKMLEEPPKGATLLLVSHQPSRLLPTIRSRCRTLALATLMPDDMTRALTQAGTATGDSAGLTELAAGSVGEAVALVQQEGLTLYAEILSLAATLPDMDRTLAARLSQSAGGRGAEARFDLTLTLTDRLMARLARSGATGGPLPAILPDEAALLARLAPNMAAGRAWADLAADLTSRARRGRAVNLDPAALILDMWLRIGSTAQSLLP
jgi:DNA polymerase III subunit delta'